MPPRRGVSPSLVALIKRVVVAAVLVAAGFALYHYYLSRRPALPSVGADQVSMQYLSALQAGDYQTAYALAGSSGQAQTSPQQMANTLPEAIASIDNWQLGVPRYSPTHTSASVPVVLYYHPTWSPEDAQHLQGKLNFRLENGQWRLIVALPFITAITKQREEQHMGGQ